MAIRLHPSPALIVRADVLISQCIDRMAQYKTRSVLVVNDRDPGDLIGIFTERDVLINFGMIRKKVNVTRSVRTVMSKPVITLDIQEIGRASELMQKHHVRHLPVTTLSEGGKLNRLVGVISKRDVFAEMASTLKDQSTVLDVLSQSDHLSKLGHSEKFCILRKPISVFPFYKILESFSNIHRAGP